MGELHQWWRTAVVGPPVWTALDLQRDQTWVHTLSAAESAQLEAIPDHARSPLPGPTQKRSDLGATVERIAFELREGRGLFLVRGLNVVARDQGSVATLCVAFARHFGVLVAQNLAGDVVRWVTDYGEQSLLDEYEVRGHRGRAEMLPHTDSAEVAGLFCIRAAKQGGTTSVLSAAAIFNELVKSAPEHLNTLQSGFYFDLTGKTEKGVSEERIPVFACEHERLVCRFNKDRIEKGMRARAVELSSAEVSALEFLNNLTCRTELAFRLLLQPGDVLFLANNYVLHARDEYQDWPDPGRKRLLLRLWLEWKMGR